MQSIKVFPIKSIHIDRRGGKYQCFSPSIHKHTIIDPHENYIILIRIWHKATRAIMHINFELEQNPQNCPEKPAIGVLGFKFFYEFEWHEVSVAGSTWCSRLSWSWCSPKIASKLDNFINFLLLYNSQQFSHFVFWLICFDKISSTSWVSLRTKIWAFDCVYSRQNIKECN